MVQYSTQLLVSTWYQAEYDFGRLLAFGDLKYVISDFDQAAFSVGLRQPF